ncbi:four helix bundle protein [Flavobacterium sp. J49]|uniref:four helix bundle protein n=1 Tax=Flavobacterium sp. J49 TaxID=2718534 RepID=UPI00159355F0|nr:four helix bundle protein [Flavobacterium sp. J49]MBF6640977.1 four helix bundle protein [Flavobacterium sp. J49]NIC02224.1 four helix bundle protein [Flavobacterium sp. J49]
MTNDLKQRTKKFALDCWILCSKLPKTREYNAYINQLIRSSSSVGANYRASQRAKSSADFLNKLKIVEEEIDESDYFLELLFEVCQMKKLNLEAVFQPLMKEAKELTAIIVEAIKTTKSNIQTK